MEAGSTLHGPQHAFQEHQVLAWTTSLEVLPESHVCDDWSKVSGSIVEGLHASRGHPVTA